MSIAERLEKHSKANFISGPNKASFPSGTVYFSCPVRAIKRKDVSQGYKVKHCFPSFTKMQTEPLGQTRKGHGPGKCNATPLPTSFLQFVVRKHSVPYQKLSRALQVVVGEGLLLEKCRLNTNRVARENPANTLKGWELIFPILPGISTSHRPEILDVCSLWPHPFQNNETKTLTMQISIDHLKVPVMEEWPVIRGRGGAGWSNHSH